MKLKYIILTIGLIVLAHLIILFVCFYQPADGTASNVPEKLGPPKTAVKNGASAAVQPGQPANPAPGVAAVQPVSESRNRQYPPFNFQTAWKGVIPELPASAGTRAGILVDADTGNVLWDKQASTPVQIASMTKLMTLLLACEDIQSGRNGITLQSPVKVSSAAMKIGGSQVWLDPKETFPLEELLKAVAIKSANDAAYLVAEFLGQGDVYGFVGRMNRRAREIGMKNTRFHNPHGLPGKTSAEDNVSSPADMALLAEYCLNHDKLMQWAAMPKADFRGGKTELVNHNNLLPGRKYPAPGVDGLKTGFINRSGYCVTVSCIRGGKRLIAVVTGFDSGKNRDLFTRSLLNWGYARRGDPVAANLKTAQFKPKPVSRQVRKTAAKKPAVKKPAAKKTAARKKRK